MNVIARQKPKIAISAEEMERRREAVRRADAHNRIEGLYSIPEASAIYEEYIRGEIVLHDIRPRIQALQPRG